MNYWLLKTEPACWSWTQQTAADVCEWDDVKNPQAQKYMRSMCVDDQAFFYHTGTERCIVGIVQIVRTAYPDPSDIHGKRCMVDVKTQKALPFPISLAAIKAEPCLQHLALIRQGRLSVVSIDSQAWNVLLDWGIQGHPSL